MNGSIVISTYPKEDDALNAAKKALEQRLAACVSITNVRSLYWWEGKIVDDNEYLAIFKTLKSEVDALKRLIKENHPYTVPEIVELSMDDVSKSYLNWMMDSINVSKKIIE
ncbi:MAG: divalent-cation tolerance protein CutA [Candidatus Nitrosocaldaceae archaeon]|nr:MAG: divalent-cation tolerance protein CutA [Candidatus Nitrosocaldaceae archaeon]